jgi:5-methylcytosine-specific restriction enzyme B
MHHHGTHDSLVYGLEFKNDDELPARFGGIGGGSALKFGIYRRAKTGEWMTGSPMNQRAMSVAEAVDLTKSATGRCAIRANRSRRDVRAEQPLDHLALREARSARPLFPRGRLGTF